METSEKPFQNLEAEVKRLQEVASLREKKNAQLAAENRELKARVATLEQQAGIAKAANDKRVDELLHTFEVRYADHLSKLTAVQAQVRHSEAKLADIRRVLG